MRYKGIYRVLAHYDVESNDFPRDTTGDIDASFDDLYIPCYGKGEIYHYGENVLCFHVDALQRGRNIVEKLNKIDSNIIMDLDELDFELEFKFKAKHIDVVASIVKPKVNGADVSPFSIRNLPKAKYVIPELQLLEYKKVIAGFTMSQIKDIYLSFDKVINNKMSKLNQFFDLSKDKKIRMLRGKEYIHAIGLWDEFIKFITNYVVGLTKS